MPMPRFSSAFCIDCTHSAGYLPVSSTFFDRSPWRSLSGGRSKLRSSVNSGSSQTSAVFLPPVTAFTRLALHSSRVEMMSNSCRLLPMVRLTEGRRYQCLVMRLDGASEAFTGRSPSRSQLRK